MNMHNRLKQAYLLVIFVSLLSLSFTILAGNDLSIKADLRNNVKSSMEQFIKK